MAEPAALPAALPLTFPWHAPLVKKIESAWLKDRLPHALLLHGQAGLGKRRLAEWVARGLLRGAPMPYVPFSLKRFVLMASRNARAFAAIADLTPARADVLIALLSGELAQCELVDVFGITAPVVSRMVRALEGLGLVARRVSPRDRRVRLVSITDQGRNSLDAFWDGWMAGEGQDSVQASSEGQLLWDWCDELADNGVGLILPTDDKGPFLRRMRDTLLSTDYWEHFLPEELARTLRAHRNVARAA